MTRGRDPFWLLKICKLGFTDSETPVGPRTKEAMVSMGEKGVGVIVIRSLPAGLVGG